MTRPGVSAALAAFMVFTVVLGGATTYLLASPPIQTRTTTSTLLSTATATRTASFTATSTASFTSISVATNTITNTITTVSVSVSSSPSYTVGIAFKQGIGFYLVDGSGMTLYFRTPDNHTGTSGCTGQCINFWPVFYTPNLLLPPGLNASSFTVVTRADGMKQIDYNNWPLHYFSGDNAPGDTNGEGIGGIWFAYELPAPSQLSSTTSITSSITSDTSGTPTTTTSSTISTTTTTSSTSTLSTTTTHTTSTTMTTSSYSYTTHSYSY